jgi:glutathionylspermidine synthase
MYKKLKMRVIISVMFDRPEERSNVHFLARSMIPESEFVINVESNEWRNSLTKRMYKELKMRVIISVMFDKPEERSNIHFLERSTVTKGELVSNVNADRSNGNLTVRDEHKMS